MQKDICILCFLFIRFSQVWGGQGAGHRQENNWYSSVEYRCSSFTNDEDIPELTKAAKISPDTKYFTLFLVSSSFFSIITSEVSFLTIAFVPWNYIPRIAHYIRHWIFFGRIEGYTQLNFQQYTSKQTWKKMLCFQDLTVDFIKFLQYFVAR